MAYAKWKGQTLPTEAQYCRAAYTEPSCPQQRRYPWGDDEPTVQHCNSNWTTFGLTAVGTHPAGQSAWSVQDLIGDAWEWTCTPFGPYDGFVPMPVLSPTNSYHGNKSKRVPSHMLFVLS
jgi:iron(II)-dependent oxidoreductase